MVGFMTTRGFGEIGDHTSGRRLISCTCVTFIIRDSHNSKSIVYAFLINVSPMIRLFNTCCTLIICSLPSLSPLTFSKMNQIKSSRTWTLRNGNQQKSIVLKNTGVGPVHENPKPNKCARSTSRSELDRGREREGWLAPSAHRDRVCRMARQRGDRATVQVLLVVQAVQHAAVLWREDPNLRAQAVAEESHILDSQKKQKFFLVHRRHPRIVTRA
jgi:hypothetical protein